jgi:hypothetical protein
MLEPEFIQSGSIDGFVFVWCCNGFMKQHITKITDRLIEIEGLIKNLNEESAMLLKFQSTLCSCQDVLLASDTFSVRTATKFELLARVAKHLNRPEPLMYGGESTKAIYEYVLSDLDSDRRQISKSRLELDEGESDLPVENDTPMSSAETTLNYNTFRSYLARFREEGRIFYNPETRRWRITKIEETTGEAHDHDDDDYRERHAE